MDLSIDHKLIKISQMQKDKYYMTSHVWNLRVFLTEVGSRMWLPEAGKSGGKEEQGKIDGWVLSYYKLGVRSSEVLFYSR